MLFDPERCFFNPDRVAEQMALRPCGISQHNFVLHPFPGDVRRTADMRAAERVLHKNRANSGHDPDCHDLLRFRRADKPEPWT